MHVRSAFPPGPRSSRRHARRAGPPPVPGPRAGDQRSTGHRGGTGHQGGTGHPNDTGHQGGTRQQSSGGATGSTAGSAGPAEEQFRVASRDRLIPRQQRGEVPDPPRVSYEVILALAIVLACMCGAMAVGAAFTLQV